MTKKLCASCAVFCFPSDSYSLQPLFLILFFSSPVPCALILLDNIKIAPAREEEKKRTSNPSTTKERAWLLPIVSPRPASSSGGGGRYIYTSTIASAEPCRACQVERSSSTYRDAYKSSVCFLRLLLFFSVRVLNIKSNATHTRLSADGPRFFSWGLLDRLTRISLGSVWLIPPPSRGKQQIKKNNWNSLICRLFLKNGEKFEPVNEIMTATFDEIITHERQNAFWLVLMM